MQSSEVAESSGEFRLCQLWSDKEQGEREEMGQAKGPVSSGSANVVEDLGGR